MGRSAVVSFDRNAILRTFFALIVSKSHRSLEPTSHGNVVSRVISRLGALPVRHEVRWATRIRGELDLFP
jgi:hypothetical protein